MKEAYAKNGESGTSHSQASAAPSRKFRQVTRPSINKKSDLSIGKTRGALYTLARLLGDVNAVQKGKVGKRVARRATGKAS